METERDDEERRDPTAQPRGREEWLAFARDALGLAGEDAAEYATRRALEDENRGRLASRPPG
jgi:hypothetical protein